MNAVVSVVVLGSDRWVVKDFGAKRWWVRHTVGRLLVHRELKALRRLEGLAGIPREPLRLGPLTLAYRFVAGETLSSVRRRKGKLEPEYFLALEGLVAQLHQRGFAHLDLRNGKNILLTAERRPHLLDFQSGLWIGCLPKPFRRLFERIDYSGVYKWWMRLAPETVDGERCAVLQKIDRRRRLWPFKPNRPRRRQRTYPWRSRSNAYE